MYRLDGDSHAEIRGDCLAHRLALPSNGTCFAAGGYKLYPPTIAYAHYATFVITMVPLALNMPPTP